MARDERRRQKALARKKAKKQARNRAGQSSAGFDGPSKSAIRNAPIHECLCAGEIREQGMGHLVITRRLPDGELVSGLFLVDIYCLGVKDTFMRVMSQHEYEELKSGLSERMATTTVTASYVRKLTEGAVNYARKLGFEPHHDYHSTTVIFGDVDPAECRDEFVFGKDGKPFYFRGPSEDQLRANRIVEQLTRRCGPDGFHYLLKLDEDDEEDHDDFEADEETSEESDDITEDILASTLPETAFESSQPVEPEKKKPRGFFRRMFGK